MGKLKVQEGSFDNRAAQVRKTLNQFKGMPQTENAGEGFITAAQVRENMLTDMRSFVKQLEALRSGSKDRVCVDLSLAEFAHRKYGFAFDPKVGTPDSFLEKRL